MSAPKYNTSNIFLAFEPLRQSNVLSTPHYVYQSWPVGPKNRKIQDFLVYKNPEDVA